MTINTQKTAKSPYIPLKVYDVNEKYSSRDRFIGGLCFFALIFAGVLGILLSFLTGFAQEVGRSYTETYLLNASLFNTVFWCLLSALVCSALYYLPSKLYTFIGGVLICGVFALIVYINFAEIADAGRYVFYTLCKRIIDSGYSINISVDLALLTKYASHAEGYINLFMSLLSVFLTMIFSFLIYSRKSVAYSLIISLLILFPCFYFGKIPATAPFMIVLAMWMAILAMNVYNRRYMVKRIRRQNKIPLKRRAKLDAKLDKKLRNSEIKVINKEIRRLRDDFKINDHTDEINKLETKIKQLKKSKPASTKPAKTVMNKEAPEKQAVTADVLRKRFTRRADKNAYDGLVGVTGFGITLLAILLAAMFIPASSILRIPLPEEIINSVSNVVEYAFSGSNASVYGGYNGGMGGGQLYNPNGISFKNKRVFEVTSAHSKTIYLKGWIGGYYTGSMWLENDKTQRDLFRSIFGEKEFPLTNQTYGFYNLSQDLNNIGESRRQAEMVQDQVTIQHLVQGGKLAFMPYFMYDMTTQAYNPAVNMDKNITLSRTLFREPLYTASTISSDFLMRRDMEVYDLFIDYVGNYTSDFPTGADANPVKMKEKYVPRVLTQFYEETDAEGNVIIRNSQEMNIMIDVELNTPVTQENSSIPGNWITTYFDYVPDSAKEAVVDSYVSFARDELKYRTYVYDNYAQVPEEMPQEIRDLALSLTNGIGNDFERALAIETYLRRNHTYTLVPTQPADPQADFVYNFLFDTKDGYCTYYATSMVMMLRSIGIPARYVEGYIVDNSYKANRQLGPNEKPYTTVYDFNAHAWAEVYFPGGGWIPFEPTTPAPAPDDAGEEEYVYRPPSNMGSGGYSMYPGASDYTEDEEFFYEPLKMSIYTKMAIVLFVFIIIVIILRCTNYVVNTRRLNKFQTINPNEATLKMLEYTIKLLSYCGYIIETDEGLVSFALRVLDKSEFMINSEFDRIVKIMQKARFSDHPISEEERSEVYQFVRMMRHSLYRNSSIFDRMRFKYFLVIL